MSSVLYAGEYVIDDSNYHYHVQGGRISRGQSFGYVFRDPNLYPAGCYGTPTAVSIPLVPRSEWPARIKMMEQTKSRISDILLGQNIPSLDQNGKGYCWAHSSVGSVIALRAVMGLRYVPLSAYAIACKIKNFRDEGGWGALSMDFLMNTGCPSETMWPAQSMNRSNDNPATWAEAASFKVTDGWIDMASAVYDRNLTFDQVMTLLFARIPVVGDFNWWGHSIYLCDPVEVSPGSFGIRFRNSWGNSYGSMGFSVLQGNRAIPDGAVAPCILTAA